MIVACAQNFFAVVVGDRRKIYSVKTDVHLSESQDNQKLNFVAGCRFAVDERHGQDSIYGNRHRPGRSDAVTHKSCKGQLGKVWLA